MTSRVRLLGIGTASPHLAIRQEDAAAAAYQLSFKEAAAERIPEIFLNTRIQSRGSVLLRKNGGPVPEQSFYGGAADAEDFGPRTRERLERFEREASPLAVRAARKALKDSGLSASQITHLITVTCTGFSAPGFDWAVVQALKLSPETERLQIGFMGCHGAVNGLRAAKALAVENPKNRVLLVSVELASLHYSYQLRVDHIISNALFADGAAACVIGAAAKKSGTGSWELAATGSNLFPGTAEHMSWKIGDHGFEMRLSSKVPKLIGGKLDAWLAPWLRKQGLGIKNIRSWAVHPGGPKVLDAVESALSLPPEATAVSRRVLSRNGNMSSATLLYILKEFYARENALPCVALGFGPGLVAEVTLWR